MANVALNIVLGLINKARPGLQATEGQLRGMKEQAEAFKQSWAGVSELSSKVGMGMTIAGGAIMAGLGGAAKSAMDFNKGIAEISTLVNTAEVDIGKLKRGINELAMETGQNAESIRGAMYEALSSGVDPAKSLEFMGVAAKAAVAGVTDTETAVNGLTNAINAFGMKTEDAGQVADSIFQAVMDGKQTFAETAKFMYEGASAAAAAKVSFKELMAASSTLTSAGIPASVAFGRIQAALMGLQRPSKEMDAIFKALGFRNAQAAVEAKGFVFALDAVKDASHGDNGALITLLGSTEAVAAANILAGTGATKFAADMERQAKSAGAAGKAYDKMAADGAAAAARLKESVGVMVRNVGDAVLPVVAGIAKALQPIIGLMARFAGTIPGKALVAMALGLGVVMAALGPVLMALPGAISAWNLLAAAQARAAASAQAAAAANVEAGAAAAAGGAGATAGAAGGVLGGLASMGARLLAMLAPVGAAIASAWAVVAPVVVGVGEAIAGVGAAILALPVGTIALIVAAVAALGVGIWQLVKHWDAVTAWFKSLPAVIGGALGNIGPFFASLWASVVSGVGNAVNSVGAWFASLPGRVSAAFTASLQAVTAFVADLPRMIGQAVGLAVGFIMWLPRGVALAGRAIGSGVQEISAWFASLPAVIGQALAPVVAFFAALPQIIGAGVARAGQWLSSLPAMALTAAQGMVMNIAAGITTAWEWLASLPVKAYEAGAGLVAALGTWLSSLPGRVAAWFAGVWDYLKGLPAEWYNSGVAMVQGLIDGVKAKWGEFIQGFREGLQKAADMLPHSDPKTGPLKGLQKSGEAMMDEFGKGIANGAGGAVSQLRDALAQLKQEPGWTGYDQQGMADTLFSKTDEGQRQGRDQSNSIADLQRMSAAWMDKQMQLTGDTSGAWRNQSGPQIAKAIESLTSTRQAPVAAPSVTLTPSAPIVNVAAAQPPEVNVSAPQVAAPNVTLPSLAPTFTAQAAAAPELRDAAQAMTEQTSAMRDLGRSLGSGVVTIAKQVQQVAATVAGLVPQVIGTGYQKRTDAQGNTVVDRVQGVTSEQMAAQMRAVQPEGSFAAALLAGISGAVAMRERTAAQELRITHVHEFIGRDVDGKLIAANPHVQKAIENGVNNGMAAVQKSGRFGYAARD